jgi:class 3 adenylate cyclase
LKDARCVNVPETRYAKTVDGVHVAYQVFGDGSTDLVLVPGTVSHVEIYWENPRLARFLRRLASFACLMVFDKRETAGALGIQVRAGLHTGECETVDGKVGGIAVHIGARVVSLAASSEVLVSQTVKDLVAGSGLVFEDKGDHELKGIPERWRLYRVVSESP